MGGGGFLALTLYIRGFKYLRGDKYLGGFKYLRIFKYLRGFKFLWSGLVCFKYLIFPATNYASSGILYLFT